MGDVQHEDEGQMHRRAHGLLRGGTHSNSHHARLVVDATNVPQYASKLYGTSGNDGTDEDSVSGEATDIEADIKREVEDMRKPDLEPLFTPITIDTECRK